MKFPKKNIGPVLSAPALDPLDAGKGARCLFATSDGRQCRMPRSEAHASLCLFHARQEQQLIDLERVSDELRSLPGEFKTNGGLNSALHQLLTLVAHGRVPPRKATTLAYIAQLLLRTLPGVRQETLAVNSFAAPSPIERENPDASG